MARVLLLPLLASLAAASNVCVVQPCAPQNVVADYVFLIDSSNAFEDYQFDQVKDWLRTWTATLKISPTGAQVALYTYGAKAVSSGTLTALSTPTAVAAAIDKLQRQNFPDRKLADAFALEETEVTAANGLRANAEKMLIVLAGDAWTGSDVLSATALTAARAKFDAILVIGVGVQPIDNAFMEYRKLSAIDSYIFWAYDISYLPYAGLWLTRHGCPNSHVDPSTVAPTTFPSPAPNAGCALRDLDLDIYLVVDTSSSMPAADFAEMRKMLRDFVAVFPLGKGQTQVGLVTTYADSQLFYTGLGTDHVNRAGLLHTLEQLQQERVDGQTLKLSLQAIENAYLKSSAAKNKLVVYVTGNTNWDADPSDYLATLNKQYSLKSVAVRWTAAADATKLASVTGGLRCAVDATSSSLRADVVGLLEQKICQNSFCR